MTLEIALVLALVVLALILFMWERVRFDVAAGIVMAVLLLSGIITPQEGLDGFSNVATVTVAAMFVLSDALTRTGALTVVGDRLSELGKKNHWMALVTMMVVVGVVSAFINNTAAVAIFLPIVLGLSRRIGVSPSKLLMPLSFASMFGGVCTLIGTSTNILVDSIAQQNGLEGFGVFEFAPLGLVFFAVGFLYLYFAGVDLIPTRRSTGDLTQTFHMKNFLTDVVLQPHSQAIGESVDETRLLDNLDLDILEVFRMGEEMPEPAAEPTLRANDVLRIRGSASEINKLVRHEDLVVRPAADWEDVDLQLGQDVLVEVVVPRNSSLINQTIQEVNFPERFGALVLAVRHQGELQREAMDRFELSGGDELLLKIDRERVPQLRQSHALVIVSEEEAEEYRRDKIPVALAIIAGVVGAAALGFFPIVVTAVTGTILMVLTGCLRVEEAYEAIEWNVIFLLGGILSLGMAMDKTGAASLLAQSMMDVVGQYGPEAMLGGLFFLTMMLTNVISNNAAAVLLAPIAIDMAEAMGVNVRPYLMAITYAASLSFMTPVGYQTNTLIYGPGQYKFTDFTLVGTPLNIIFWIIGTLLIPVIWPLR